jgi:hypothetical protein
MAQGVGWPARQAITRVQAWPGILVALPSGEAGDIPSPLPIENESTRTGTRTQGQLEASALVSIISVASVSRADLKVLTDYVLTTWLRSTHAANTGQLSGIVPVDQSRAKLPVPSNGCDNGLSAAPAASVPLVSVQPAKANCAPTLRLPSTRIPMTRRDRLPRHFTDMDSSLIAPRFGGCRSACQ